MSRNPVTIALIAAGEMGAGLGRSLTDDGIRVLTSLAGRGAATLRRAAEAGMEDAPDEVLAAADLILSVTPPSQALAVAERLAPAIAAAGTSPFYVDGNAVSPERACAIGQVAERAGARFVDAGVIGAPPRRGYKPVIYASGPHAAAFQSLAAPSLDVRLLPGPVGQASALKLCYSALNKGLCALAAATILGAHEAGVEAELIAELEASQAGVLEQIRVRLPGIFPKAYRWDPEMSEIADFLGGPAGQIYEGAAQMFRRLAADHAGAQSDEATILAFLRGALSGQPIG